MTSMSGEIYWVQYQISVQFSTWIFLKIFLECQNLNQSAHFLKQQSPLYCTVRYHCNKETEKPSYSYYYHISDDLTHEVKWISMKLKFHNLNLTTVHASISTKCVLFLAVFSKRAQEKLYYSLWSIRPWKRPSWCHVRIWCQITSS